MTINKKIKRKIGKRTYYLCFGVGTSHSGITRRILASAKGAVAIVEKTSCNRDWNFYQAESHLGSCYWSDAIGFTALFSLKNWPLEKCRVVCVLWHQICKKSKETNSLWLHHVIQEHTDINLHCIIHQENDIAVLLSCTLKEKIIASLSTGGHKIIKASIKFKGRLEKSDIGKI